MHAGHMRGQGCCTMADSWCRAKGTSLLHGAWQLMDLVHTPPAWGTTVDECKISLPGMRHGDNKF